MTEGAPYQFSVADLLLFSGKPVRNGAASLPAPWKYKQWLQTSGHEASVGSGRAAASFVSRQGKESIEIEKELERHHESNLLVSCDAGFFLGSGLTLKFKVLFCLNFEGSENFITDKRLQQEIKTKLPLCV